MPALSDGSQKPSVTIEVYTVVIAGWSAPSLQFFTQDDLAPPFLHQPPYRVALSHLLSVVFP